MNTEISTITIPAFPKIWHLGDPKIADIFDGPIEITEKIDGSQFSFGTINGELQYRTKGVTNDKVDSGMFGIVIEWMNSIQHKLRDNVIFHGEYLQSPRHNTLMYSRVPKSHFCLFGIRDLNVDLCSPHESLVIAANEMGCDAVPLIYYGEWKRENATELFKFIEEESFLGGTQMEGIVVKNYAKKGEFAGRELPLLAGKFVSENFKEKHKSNTDYLSNKDKVWTIAQQYRGAPRWIKAVYKFRDEGKLTYSPKDIGDLLKYINSDFLDEEMDNIKEQLWKGFERDIRKIVQGGFPEWYKEWLVEENFNGTNE